MIGEKGEYLINEAAPRRPKQTEAAEVKKPVKRIPVAHRVRDIEILAEAVHQWPLFPGGGEAFMKYLDQLGKELTSYLPQGMLKAFVQVEFIIDKDGVPVNIKVLKGFRNGEDFNEELIARLEKMGTWEPAILNDKPVAKKMIQTITVGASQ